MSAPTGMQLCLDAQSRFEAAGIADAYNDATRLFLHALEQSLGKRVPRHQLAQHLKQQAPAELSTAFASMVAARAARQPVSQIIGRRAFWEHEFQVTRETLDPRPETETLVEAALARPWQSVLDMGTGTGAILISLLAARPDATGQGTDISTAALDVARANAAKIGVTATFTRADWYAGVEGRFDLIVSNPPYIALDEMAGLAPEVRDWEQASALTDGGDGLAAYRAIAAGARAHLAPGGSVLVEIGASQAPAVSELFAAQGAVTEVLRDLDGRNRVISAVFPAK